MIKKIKKFKTEDLVKSKVKELLLTKGIHIGRSINTNESRLILDSINRNRILNVMDIGANTGQFAIKLLHGGFNGNLHSYEPDPTVFDKLNKHTENFNLWKTFNEAILGPERNGDSEVLKISSNTGLSSSFLEPTQNLYDIYSHVKFNENVEVRIIDLNSALTRFPEGNILIKADVQGSEKEIFMSINLKKHRNIKAIALEISHIQIYHGEWKIEDCLNYFAVNGFVLTAISMEDYRSEIGAIQSNLIFENRNENE